MNSKILVSGASGLIGAALLRVLRGSGYSVMCLVRRPANSDAEIAWRPDQPISPEAVSGFDAVIHLAGESIVGRWTAAKKQRIRESRVMGTRNLAHALASAPRKPQVFVSSSAIGYYGDRGEEILTEESSPGAGFLAEVCREWEAATEAAAKAGIRTVQIRTGVVLSAAGGALAKMLPPFKLGLGGILGNGRQWMSWIDIQDMVDAIQHIVKTDALRGPVNMIAPAPVSNLEFTKTLAGALKRPAIFPMPAFMVKLAFGEMGETVLLGSQRVEPAKLAAGGYQFTFRDLRTSLAGLLTR
ncbi:MAG TPA: TIGR01777 family oxidoreductase [Candidatus Sulfotelmatobacter sp.]